MAGFEISPSNLRNGADRIDAEKSAVEGLSVPDPGPAEAGLAGFTTVSALRPARDAMVSALKVAGGRFETMGRLIRDTANTFEQVEKVFPGSVKKPWMSQHVGNGLTAMGDMNLRKS